MNMENPSGCVYPKCKCRFRCKDLFELNSVIEVVGGICPTCKKSTTLYNFSSGFICKNCIAVMLNVGEIKISINSGVSCI